MLILALAIGLCLARPASAQATSTPASCPAGPVPAIRVAVMPLELHYDRSLDSAALEGLDVNLTPDWLAGRGKLLGFTRHRLAPDYTALTALTAPVENGVCVGFRDGTLGLRVETTIHLAAEIPPGSCLDREAVDHEWQHHERGLALIETLARDIEARLATALAEEPFVVAPSAGAVAATAIDRLQRLMAPAIRDFEATYPAEQLELDTPAEYQRVLDACPGEQQRLLED